MVLWHAVCDDDLPYPELFHFTGLFKYIRLFPFPGFLQWFIQALVLGFTYLGLLNFLGLFTFTDLFTYNSKYSRTPVFEYVTYRMRSSPLYHPVIQETACLNFPWRIMWVKALCTYSSISRHCTIGFCCWFVTVVYSSSDACSLWYQKSMIWEVWWQIPLALTALFLSLFTTTGKTINCLEFHSSYFRIIIIKNKNTKVKNKK